jgi:hypothetical protein
MSEKKEVSDFFISKVFLNDEDVMTSVIDVKFARTTNFFQERTRASTRLFMQKSFVCYNQEDHVNLWI